MPTTSPDNTKAETITDSKGAVWTLGEKDKDGFGNTLRNGVAVRGKGSIYKYVSSIVHTLGTDNDWYAWIDARSRWESIGAKEPGAIEQPSPATGAKYSYVTQDWPTSGATVSADQLKLINDMGAQGYRWVAMVTNGKTFFEKVG